MHAVKKSLVAVAALGAMALGASAIADAASKSSATPSASSTPAAGAQGYGAPPQGAPGRPPGRHIGANGKQEQALAADVADKVAAAAKAKLPGATLERTETD